MLRTAWVVVRRMVRRSSPPRSIVMVCSATWTVTTDPAWIRPRGDLLPGHHDHAGVAGPPLHRDGLGGRPWRWPGGAGALESAGLVPGQRAGPGAQRLPGLRVEEHQRVLLDADADPAAAEDLRSEDVAVGAVDRAVFGHDPLDLDRGAGFGFGQRRWPGGPRPGGYQLGQVGGG